MTESTTQPEPRTDTAADTVPADEHAEQLERYVRFWNAGTEQEQRRLAAAVFTDGVDYRAEVGILSGAQALMDFRNQFVAHMGTAALRLRERPRVHHDRARLRWEILTGDGGGEGGGEGGGDSGGNGDGGADGDRTSFAAGTDVIQFAEDGRISSVTAFLDRAPEGFDPAAHQ